MKKRDLLLIFLCIIFLLGIFNTNAVKYLWSRLASKISKPDLEYVRNSQWVYEKGFKIGEGDFLEFNASKDFSYLSGDTIFYKDRPAAIVSNTNKYLYEMTVYSLDKKEKGFYANTAESTGGQ